MYRQIEKMGEAPSKRRGDRGFMMKRRNEIRGVILAFDYIYDRMKRIGGDNG